jgi:hypothetical protein
MRPLVILCVLATSVSASTRVVAGVLAGPIPFGGHLYYVLEPAGWNDSEVEAVMLGGHLTTINDAAENEWVVRTFNALTPEPENEGLWIGFNDTNVEGNFEWVSGESVTYTNWLLDEPNDFGGMEDFANITLPTGPWNDIPESGHSGIFGVVEVIPEPSGDFDDDGDVDGSDFLYWQRNDGSKSDLTVWQENFGNPSVVAPSQSIPEPSTLLLGALAAVGLLVTFRQSRK